MHVLALTTAGANRLAFKSTLRRYHPVRSCFFDGRLNLYDQLFLSAAIVLSVRYSASSLSQILHSELLGSVVFKICRERCIRVPA